MGAATRCHTRRAWRAPPKGLRNTSRREGRCRSCRTAEFSAAVQSRTTSADCAPPQDLKSVNEDTFDYPQSCLQIICYPTHERNSRLNCVLFISRAIVCSSWILFLLLLLYILSEVSFFQRVTEREVSLEP